MTSSRPYLVRALYEWIMDNHMTPHLLVDANHPQTMVPDRFVQDGKIVLNISPTAIHALVLGNERIAFGARFGGAAMQVEVPVDAVLGIYARENGHGMLFPDNGPQPDDDAQKPDAKKPEAESHASRPPRARPMLKVVK